MDAKAVEGRAEELAALDVPGERGRGVREVGGLGARRAGHGGHIGGGEEAAGRGAPEEGELQGAEEGEEAGVRQGEGPGKEEFSRDQRIGRAPLKHGDQHGACQSLLQFRSQSCTVSRFYASLSHCSLLNPTATGERQADDAGSDEAQDEPVLLRLGRRAGHRSSGREEEAKGGA